MQAQEAAIPQETDLYSYRRGDIPMFNYDAADKLLLKTLRELIEALRKLREETGNHKRETELLRRALQECKACRIKRPECSDVPPPCFPGVDCRDTPDGPLCGPCPPGFKASPKRSVPGGGTFIRQMSVTQLTLSSNPSPGRRSLLRSRRLRRSALLQGRPVLRDPRESIFPMRKLSNRVQRRRDQLRPGRVSGSAAALFLGDHELHGVTDHDDDNNEFLLFH